MALLHGKFTKNYNNMNKMLKNWHLNVALLLALTFFLIYFTNHHILTASFFENSDDPLSGIPSKNLALYEYLQRWIYIASAIYLMGKLFLISLMLYIGIYLTDQPVKFTDLFAVTVLAEYLFLIPAIIKLITFPLLFPQGTLADWNQYYIFSLLSLRKNVPADWKYALQTINVFEIAYWFLLALGIKKISAFSYDRSLQIVLTTYLPALFVWVAVISFLTLMLFPAYS